MIGWFWLCLFTAESEYSSLTEEKAAAVLADICLEPFIDIQENVRRLFEH
jgi:hypothetical protein